MQTKSRTEKLLLRQFAFFLHIKTIRCRISLQINSELWSGFDLPELLELTPLFDPNLRSDGLKFGFYMSYCAQLEINIIFGDGSRPKNTVPNPKFCSTETMKC